MVFEIALGEHQWVVNAGLNKFQSVMQHGHFLLKDVVTVAQAHRQLLHFALPKRKDKRAWLLQSRTQLNVAATRIQGETGCMLEPF